MLVNQGRSHAKFISFRDRLVNLLDAKYNIESGELAKVFGVKKR